MKILIIQENGRHPENKEFRECFNLQRALLRKNIDTIVWGLGHINFNTPFQEIIKDIDVIILLENYESNGWLPDLSNVNKLKIFWSIDSHMVLMNHITTVVKNKIDIVLNAIESHQNYFKTSKTFYFPNAYPSDLISPIDGIDKNTFLGFCGSLLNRSEILDKLENKFGLKKDIWKLGNEMIKTINGYKIHFNKTLSNDINYRIFETMGCNTLILTNHTENINTFFNDMENIVIYNNETELFEKLNILLSDNDLIKKISNSGYKLVKNNHTYDNRADVLLKIISDYI
jgi:glycosyltransferase involved in cell wall biosynthesis